MHQVFLSHTHLQCVIEQLQAECYVHLISVFSSICITFWNFIQHQTVPSIFFSLCYTAWALVSVSVLCTCRILRHCFQRTVDKFFKHFSPTLLPLNHIWNLESCLLTVSFTLFMSLLNFSRSSCHIFFHLCHMPTHDLHFPFQICYLAINHGHSVSQTFCCPVFLLLRAKVPTGNFRSREQKFPGTFVPGSECSREHSFCREIILGSELYE